jgi:hypothetical protein
LHSKPSWQVVPQVPSAWQVRHWAGSQVPQVTESPQLLVAVPHVLVPQVVALDSAVQPQTPAVPPPPHVLGAVQVAQAPLVPQAALVFPGWQFPLPSQQPELQVQVTVSPQLSLKVPHLPA